MSEAEADAYVHAVALDWRIAPLSDGDRALCEFAVKLTQHQKRMTKDDVARLREHGFEDRAVLDAAQVVGYFNYITRVADSLGVEPESFIHPWGQP